MLHVFETNLQQRAEKKYYCRVLKTWWLLQCCNLWQLPSWQKTNATTQNKRGKWSEKLKTLLWYFKVYRSKLLSYHTPSRCIWTQIWLRTADTSRWQHTHQTAGRRTSLPDKTRQVSGSCQSPYMSDSVEQNQV